MRLTILNQFYRPDISPTAHLSASLAEHRAAQGDDVTVVTSRGGYVDAGTNTDRGGENPRVYRAWTPQLGKASTFKRLIDYGAFYFAAAIRMITLPPQDVVIALTTPPFIAWAAVLHKILHRRCRLVLWNMDCYPEIAERTGVIQKGGLLSKVLRSLNRALFRRLDHLVCLDTAMVELLLSAYEPGKRSLPTTIIPNWEDLALFPADVAPEPWSPLPPDAGAERFTVLYLGNTGYGHAFDTVLDAAEELQDEAVDFLFVGGGSRWQEIHDEAERRGLKNVVMHPYVPKERTPNLMAAADAALITLRDDSLGVMSPSKLHANLAMALPVIYVGPAKSNVDDAIRDHGCGVSLRHGDVGSLVRFVRHLMHHRDDQARMRAASRSAFDASYCDRVTLRQFDRLIESLGLSPVAATAPAVEGARASR